MKKIIFTIITIGFGTSGYAQQMIYQTPETTDLRNTKDPVELNQKLSKLGASGAEKDYSTLYTYYQITNRRLADSIAKIATSKYPKGSVAFNRASSKILVGDIVQQEQVLTTLRTEFPDQDFNRLYSHIIRNFLAEKNALAAIKYLKLMSGTEKSAAWANVIGTVSNYNAWAAADYITHELADENISERDKMKLLYLQSQVLTKTGDYQKAFQSVKAYYDYAPRKTPQLEADYYGLMSKVDRQAEAFPHLEKAVLKMIGGEETKQELIDAYHKLNPEKDVNTYMAGLRKMIDVDKQVEIAKSMIKEKSPSFSVLDANGKTVSLADFKGKTIVIDFWATWCGPCKLSLPGMQATVNKYKDDPNVAFLFIHTWEKKNKEANPVAAAKKYFAENNYGNLPLYMDLENANKVNPAVSAFKVTGIPAKFVIDGQGNIRFKKEGAGIDIDYAVTELSAMIELSKKATVN